MTVVARDQNRRFVVVSGLPGSGKSALGRAVAPLLALPLLDKDDLLERLFDSVGVGDAAWRRRLSRESDAQLQAEATVSNGAVLVSFWHQPGMPPDSGTPTDWLRLLSPYVVHLRCICPAALAADRFLRRTRHPGHLDRDRTHAEVTASLEQLAALEPLHFGQSVEVSTDAPLEPALVAARVQAAFQRVLPV